jgi:hypothetical protein
MAKTMATRRNRFKTWMPGTVRYASGIGSQGCATALVLGHAQAIGVQCEAAGAAAFFARQLKGLIALCLRHAQGDGLVMHQPVGRQCRTLAGLAGCCRGCEGCVHSQTTGEQTMEEVNWPVFQAAAALVGAKLAASRSERIDMAIEKDLPDVYQALLQAAQRIHQQVLEDRQQALAAMGQRPSMDLSA